MRGITLLETLIVTGIIGILMAIAIPTLRAGADAARAATCLATLRGVAQATEAYASDTGHYPHFAKPQLHEAFTNEGVPRNYFAQSGFWLTALRGYIGEGGAGASDPPGAFCPWNPMQEILTEERAGRRPTKQDAHTNIYQLSSALFSGAALWSPEAPVVDASQLRPVRAGNVAHPSSKSMYHEWFPSHALGIDHDASGSRIGNIPMNIVFCDGGAATIPRRLLPDPVPNPFDAGGGRSSVLANTVNGHLGLDLP